MLPAPKPVTEDAEILPRPAPSFREDLASLPGNDGRQAPSLPAPLLVEPPAPLAAASDVTAPSGAPLAADPAAPPVAAEQTVVADGVAVQPEGSATTDVQGQSALPASSAPPSGPPPTLAPPPPVQAGSAPVAWPVVAPPTPRAVDLSVSPAAVPGVPVVANPSAPSAPHPQSPGRRQQRPQSPARQAERATSRRRLHSPRHAFKWVTSTPPSASHRTHVPLPCRHPSSSRHHVPLSLAP
ncbi:unnamed protein product [Closterium sp. NIES-65]|nr:unnamed protein product [Closterium sp. NIES-65]